MGMHTLVHFYTFFTSCSFLSHCGAIFLNKLWFEFGQKLHNFAGQLHTVEPATNYTSFLRVTRIFKELREHQQTRIETPRVQTVLSHPKLVLTHSINQQLSKSEFWARSRRWKSKVFTGIWKNTYIVSQLLRKFCL